VHRFAALATLVMALASMAEPAIAAEPAALFTPPAPDAQVGVVGSTLLTYKELPSALQQSLQQNRDRYEQRRLALDFEYRRAQRTMIDSTVNQVLDQKGLDLEARAQNTTTDKLLAGVSVPAVSDAEVQAFYDQHRDQLKKPFAEARGQVAEYLQAQAKQTATRTYLDALRAKYGAQPTLDPPRQEVAASGPVRGPANAAVTIIEFADFQCPYCGRLAPVLKQVLAKYPKDVRLVYREFPLYDIHQDAMHAAVAGVCAAEQGKFWELHDALFADQSALGDQAVVKAAERVGIKLQPFASCLLSSTAYDAVRSDIRAGNEAGVSGTPGLFVNGRFYDGYMPLEALTAVVEDELRRGSVAARVRATPAAGALPAPVTRR
jgi:protein-disulfide isomerase